MFYITLYVEVNVVCFAVLMFVLAKLKGDIGSKAEVAAFRNVVLATAALLLLDVIWVLGENGAIRLPPTGNAVLNAVFMSVTGYVSYAWFLFTEHKLRKSQRPSTMVRWVTALPCLALCAACVASIWTGWVFYIDAKNVYHRGNLYIWQVVISYLYMVVAALHSVLRGLREVSRAKRREAFTLASFIIIPACGCLIQALVYGIPAALPSITLSILIVFLNFLEAQISRDALTGLDNRRRIDEYLDTLMENVSNRQRLILFVADIDCFKIINDTYGHLEGDRALTLVADALKTVCNRYDTCLARTGGDEFCIVWSCAAGAQPLTLVNNLRLQLEATCQKHKLAYKLTLSMGFDEYTDGKSAVQMMNAADTMLYANKARVHGNRL